jgi:hypothetical protein
MNIKDINAINALGSHFQQLELPPDAAEWLLMLFHAIQFFDDIADDDEIERDDFNMALWNTLIRMPSNRFFVEHSGHLMPLMSSMILKWQASDSVEREKQPDARSFMWRAGYYDIVLAVLQLCHGVECATKNAHHVMRLYGESLEDYLNEFRG